MTVTSYHRILPRITSWTAICYYLVTVLLVVAPSSSRASFAADGDAPSPEATRPGEPMTFNPDDPEARIPTQEEADANPLEFGYYLMELARYATDAENAKDYKKALAFYRTMALASPLRPTGPRKGCELLIKLGRTLEAEEACRAVLTREEVRVQDFRTWLKLVARESDKLPPDVLSYAAEAIEHLQKQPGGELAALQAQCELGVSQREPKLLRTCVPRLLELAPDDVTTVVFAWHESVATGEISAAQSYLERLRELGMDEAVLARMRAAAEAQEEAQSAASGGCSLGRSLWALLIGLIFGGLAYRRSRRT